MDKPGLRDLVRGLLRDHRPGMLSLPKHEVYIYIYIYIYIYTHM